MQNFMDHNFLLDTEVAQQLYSEVAADLPIIDYHSHLQQGEIAAQKQFRNIAELWLAGDHYKWRLMRSAGVGEDFITGAQSDEAKFLAFCRVFPHASRTMPSTCPSVVTPCRSARVRRYCPNACRMPPSAKPSRPPIGALGDGRRVPQRPGGAGNPGARRLLRQRQAVLRAMTGLHDAQA